LMISKFLVVLSRGKVWIAKIHLNLRDVFTDPRCCALVLQARRAWGLDGHFLKVRGALLSHVPFLGRKKIPGLVGMAS
jgi:hypothetical protein